jgi:YegS/Rv2252/BmrU family lipid kinase
LTREGCETLVAAGGDGTVNEVLNGICDVPDGLARTRLGVIPLGTVNVFAKEMEIPEEFRGAWQVIRNGRERSIDLPRAEFTGEQGNRECRHFILMAGAGLDSRAIGLVDWGWKRRLGPLAYVWAGIRAMKPPHPQLTVRVAERSHRVELAEVGNGRFYGGRFPVFPNARLDDGVLDVTLFPRVGWLCALRVFLRLVTHRLSDSSSTILLQGREITFASEEPVSLQLDGDLVGHLPVTLTVRPQALRVVVV